MPEDTAPAGTGNTTTTPQTPAATPAPSTTGTTTGTTGANAGATAAPSTGKPQWTVSKLSAEELSALERDMQLKDPADVVLPGGKTLKELQDTQHALQVAETEAEAKKEKPLPAHSSTVMTTETAVAVNDTTGQVVTVPLVPPPTEEVSREAE